jgi:hypothetical protein
MIADEPALFFSQLLNMIVYIIFVLLTNTILSRALPTPIRTINCHAIRAYVMAAGIRNLSARLAGSGELGKPR